MLYLLYELCNGVSFCFHLTTFIQRLSALDQFPVEEPYIITGSFSYEFPGAFRNKCCYT